MRYKKGKHFSVAFFYYRSANQNYIVSQMVKIGIPTEANINGYVELMRRQNEAIFSFLQMQCIALL